MTRIVEPARPTPPPSEPQPRRWTKEEYHAMGRLGWFEDQHVELLAGAIVGMPVPGNAHCVSTDNVGEALRPWFPRDAFWVRMQMPLDLGLDTEPQPDVAVVTGPKSSFTAHPKSALLVVEVSDSTLQIDRGRKASLYAAGGIPEYWIVNLQDRQVEVMKGAVPDPAAPYGARYAQSTIHKPTDTLVPDAAPPARIAVGELLP